MNSCNFHVFQSSAVELTRCIHSTIDLTLMANMLVVAVLAFMNFMFVDIEKITVMAANSRPTLGYMHVHFTLAVDVYVFCILGIFVPCV
jgi:hypothetical protein